MWKKLKSSLTLRIFLITSAFMLVICLITYGAIAYLTPISYTAILADELKIESEALVGRLEQVTVEDCISILEDFTRQIDADMRLTDEYESVLYNTMPQNDNAAISSDMSESSVFDNVQSGWTNPVATAPEAIFYTPIEAVSEDNTQQDSEGNATTVVYEDEYIVAGSMGASSPAMDYSEVIEQVTVVENKSDSDVAYNFFFADGISATLIVQGGQRAVNQASEAMERLLPFLLLMVFAISLLGSFFYARMITKPIVSISRIAKRMAGLDFDARWDEHRADEIGVLGESLNLLSKNLSGALTDLQSANEALQEDIERERELERQRSTFFSAASHELKTPVTILKGQLSGMLAQVGIYQDREKYLARALAVTGQMEGLIKETLIISRLESSSFTLGETAVDISALMENQLSIVEELIAQKEMRLEANIDPCVIVVGNKSLLINVLDNVLMNAILYSPQKASIIVEVHEGMLSVENSGVSIPEDLLSELFTPFYRVEQSRNRKSGGSGLGLYLVQSILKLHGATCMVENRSNGVRFIATF